MKYKLLVLDLDGIHPDRKCPGQIRGIRILPYQNEDKGNR